MAWGMEEWAAAIGIFIGVAGFGLAAWHEYLRHRNRLPRLDVRASWSYVSDPRRPGLQAAMNVEVVNVGVRPAQLNMIHFQRKNSDESMILRDTLIAGFPKKLDIEETFQHVVPTIHFMEWAQEKALGFPLTVRATVQTPRGNVHSKCVDLQDPGENQRETKRDAKEKPPKP